MKYPAAPDPAIDSNNGRNRRCLGDHGTCYGTLGTNSNITLDLNSSRYNLSESQFNGTRFIHLGNDGVGKISCAIIFLKHIFVMYIQKACSYFNEKAN